MYLVWPKTDPWEALREAIAPALAPILEAAAPGAPLTLAEAPEGAPLLTLSDGVLALSPELLGPAVHAGDDRRWLAEAPEALAPLALDRWRRSVGVIAEGVLLQRMAGQLGVPAASLPQSWWTVGAAAEEVDRLSPQLGWLWQSAAGLLLLPWQSMQAQPRRGAWFLRWRSLQDRPVRIGDASPPAITPQEWAEFGQWCRDPQQGPAAGVPLPMAPAPPRDPPAEPLQPLSHHPVRWSAGPAGLRVDGAALAPPVRLGSNEAVVAVLGAVEGGQSTLIARPARLVGRWTIRSGQANQRLGVAAGIDLHFSPGGQLEITLANAWMAPADAENNPLARQLGASGTGTGRWQVVSLKPDDGSGVVRLTELDIGRVTLHPRRPRMRRFGLPAGEGQLERVRRLLGQLSEHPVTFTLQDGELILDGELRNYTVQLRLTPA